MANENLKRLMEVLPFRDAVLLHNELRSPKPLSKEMQDKVRQALRSAKFTILPQQ
ncbi:hypothetical protein [Diaphorobacter sp. J5-51]|uniref:hypothetical protein n=1 Tax=Diaphorobacter sp. J5-51 TaxID=680496 RepID=UPI0012F874F8|nr:hypothetical protein [Diaphorobacter sp. J5-51]